MNMLRQTLRQLFRNPGFSLTVTVFLGVSVAALLALATAAWALLAKPLPFPDGDRLVNVHGFSSKMGFELGFSVPMAERLAQFEQVEAVGFHRTGDEMEDDSGARLRTTRISASLLSMLGARPLIGRLLVEDEPDGGVLISETFWENRFNRDPGVLDRAIELPGFRLHVIGVLPRSFGFPHPDTALWQPLMLTGPDRAPDQIGNWQDMQVYVRLKAGTSAQAFAEAIEARWGALPELAPMREFMGLQIRVATLRKYLSERNASLLRELSMATLLVLLTLAANLANLWLGRAVARQRELAVRGALGASGWRLAAPVLFEIVLLTIVGVVVGLALAPLGLDALQAVGVFDSGSPLPIGLDIATVLAALLAAALLIRLLSTGPLWLIRRGFAPGELSSGPRTLALSLGGARLRRGLVAFQVAAAVTLLVGGGLLWRSMDALMGSDTGFAGRGLVVASITPKDARLIGTDASAGQRVSAWYADVSSLPGVKAASFATAPPFARTEVVSSFELVGEGRQESARDRLVGPGYFDVIRQPVIAGRAFSTGDTGVVIVDELFVKRHLAGVDPLQASIGVPVGRNEYEPARIVGVVPTIKHSSLDEGAALGSVYRQIPDPAQSGMLPRYALLEIDGGGSGAMRVRLEELAQAHGLRLEQSATIAEWMRASLNARMPLMWLLSGFAVACLLLCCTGLFALVQFAVRSRRGEFGLKLALGATANALSREVLVGAARTVLPGLVLGVVGAMLLGRVLASRLYQVSPYDPLTFVAVLMCLLAAVLLAAWWPARRVQSVAPAEVLRGE